MLDFLLIVEHKPALGAEYLPVGLGFDVFYLENEVFPLFTILFNHFLFNKYKQLLRSALDQSDIIYLESNRFLTF